VKRSPKVWTESASEKRKVRWIFHAQDLTIRIKIV